ncbi:FeoA family protein [Spirochaeta cellobiosiphila]|uniref:FeoA family protein n=1 Tax=Spirochaeta cellobiosiphila TaxID=504483 RepID=UPI00041B6566|nr:FeoA family protein [Spirochaeta cellobiosiphila]
MNNTKAPEFPLLFAQDNDELIISNLRGGGEFKEKCISQALIPGQTIKMIRKAGEGPCLVMVNNTRVMISHGMLNRIMVQPN